MSGFPKLIPAFTAHIALSTPIPIDTLSKGTYLTIVPFGTAHSSLISEPTYPIKINATFTHGSDYIRQDPSGQRVRLDVNSVLEDESGAMIVFKYTGVVEMTERTAKVLGGKEGACTTGFGDGVTHVLFETGSEELKGLEAKIYVASGRFILEEGKPVIVEYKISEVSP